MSRRGQVAVAILVLWAAGLVLLVRREFFRPRTQRLIEAGLRVAPGAAYYAVFQNGRQIGFASSTIDTLPGTIKVADYLVADLPVGGRLHRASARTNVQLTRALRVRNFDFSLESEQGPLKATGLVQGDSAVLVAIQAGDTRPDTQRVRLDGPIYMPTTLPLVVALGERPRVGRRYSLPVFDPLTMKARDVEVAVRAESLFVVSDSARFDSATSRWQPADPDTVRAWQMVQEGATGFTGWVDRQGRILEAVQPQLGNLLLRRMPYEIAFGNWRLESQRARERVAADEDILETTAVGANALRRKRRVARLVVRLTNVDLAGYDLDGGRQRLRGDTLDITQEPAARLRATYVLPSGMRQRFKAETSPEPLVQSGSFPIVALATRIAGPNTDPRVVAERLNRWVYDSLEKRITFGIPSALQVLERRSGDCNEHTQLYLALARAMGIPARAAAGLAYLDGKFYYHAWPEVYLDGWVAVDPTFGQFPADAAHLRFTIGGLGRQAELLRLMGNLRIEVLSAR